MAGAELREAIRQAEVVHADETSWRLAGTQEWLWLGAAALLACYRIDPSRSQQAAKELLGEDFGRATGLGLAPPRSAFNRPVQVPSTCFGP